MEPRAREMIRRQEFAQPLSHHVGAWMAGAYGKEPYEVGYNPCKHGPVTKCNQPRQSGDAHHSICIKLACEELPKCTSNLLRTHLMALSMALLNFSCAAQAKHLENKVV